MPTSRSARIVMAILAVVIILGLVLSSIAYPMTV